MADSVHKSDVSKIQLPELAIIEDRGLSLCKEPFPVLASISDSSYYKNDRTLVDGKFDSIDVYLEDESGNEELAPGTAVNYPNQSDAVGFIVDWRQYTEVVGGVTRLKAGCYKIKVYYDIAGITGHFYYGSYRLLPYTVQNAEGTSRIFVVLNGYVRETDINYRDSGFAGTFRFRGKFGDEQWNYDMEDITEISRVTYTVRNESINSYILKTEPLLSCFTKQINAKHLLVASQIFISDHSTYAHQQYYDLPVILDKEKSPELNHEGMGPYAKVTAYFKEKVKKKELKYSGDINGSTNAILDLPTGTQAEGCLAATVTINTNEITDTIISGGSKNYNLLDQNGDPINVDSVSGDNVTLNTHWVRNPNWLPMPEINIGDERLVGLYAVFEEEPFSNTNSIACSANIQIDWGDGTVVTSVAGQNTHAYDYATISSPILTTSDGRNYKMVIVDLDFSSGSVATAGLQLQTTVFTDEDWSQTGWLDIMAASTKISSVQLFDNFERFSPYLERCSIKEIAPTGTYFFSFRRTSNLKILDIPNYEDNSSYASYLTRSGDIRTSSGQPFTINDTVTTNISGFAIENTATEFGDITLTAGTNGASMFFYSNLRKIGDVNVPSTTTLNRFIERSNTHTLGTITVTTALTNINSLARFNVFIRSIVFAGDMSSVTDTNSAFQACQSLHELILPNITVGFDISDTKISGTYLQALFTSLGTASGAQTITLPNFTMGEDTSIATGKGFTIAYA